MIRRVIIRITRRILVLPLFLQLTRLDLWVLYALKARAARLPSEAFKCAALRSAGGADEMPIKQHFVKRFVAPASLRQDEGSCPRGHIIQAIRLMICNDAQPAEKSMF